MSKKPRRGELPRINEPESEPEQVPIGELLAMIGDKEVQIGLLRRKLQKAVAVVEAQNIRIATLEGKLETNKTK